MMVAGRWTSRGVSSPITAQMSSADQARLLVAEKEAIEAELDKQLQILKANSADMRTPLVDAEGFPRDDIDVFLVRGARVRIIELRNDLAAVMDQIARKLEVVYAPSSATESDADIMKAGTNPETLPFARVDGVAPGSPASEAVCSQSIAKNREWLQVCDPRVCREKI